VAEKEGIAMSNITDKVVVITGASGEIVVRPASQDF